MLNYIFTEGMVKISIRMGLREITVRTLQLDVGRAYGAPHTSSANHKNRHLMKSKTLLQMFRVNNEIFISLPRPGCIISVLSVRSRVVLPVVPWVVQENQQCPLTVHIRLQAAALSELRDSGMRRCCVYVFFCTTAG